MTFTCSKESCQWKEKNPPCLQAIGIICPNCGLAHRWDGKEWIPRPNWVASGKPGMKPVETKRDARNFLVK